MALLSFYVDLPPQTSALTSPPSARKGCQHLALEDSSGVLPGARTRRRGWQTGTPVGTGTCTHLEGRLRTEGARGVGDLRPAQARQPCGQGCPVGPLPLPWGRKGGIVFVLEAGARSAAQCGSCGLRDGPQGTRPPPTPRPAQAPRPPALPWPCLAVSLPACQL